MTENKLHGLLPYSEKQAAKLLDISESCLRKYRYQGLIEYVQATASGKVFYTGAQIIAFCNRHTKRNTQAPTKKPKRPKGKSGGAALVLLCTLMQGEWFLNGGYL